MHNDTHKNRYRGGVGRKLAPRVAPYTAKDGTVTYRVRLRVHGRQTTETFDTQVAANVFVARVIDPDVGPERAVQMRDREDTSSTGYIPTVKEMLERHVEGLTGVEDQTRADYLAIAGRTWLPMLGSFRVDELTRADIARWVNKISGSVKPKTIRNAHSIISATMNTAMQEIPEVTANPARGTRLPRAGEEEVEDIQFLTHAEFDLLHGEIPDFWRPQVRHMFGTGMRWGELTAQQGRDQDLAAGRYVGDDWVPTPRARVVRAWKKGGGLGPPKSKAGRRSLVLPFEVAEDVEHLIKGRPTSAFLFTTKTGQPVRHSNFYNRVWRPAVIRASICEEHLHPRCRCGTTKPLSCPVHTERTAKGHQIVAEPCGCPGTLPFRPSPHDARHTHASWLIDQGIRLDVLRDRLGHEDILTTMRYYGHLMPDVQLEAGVAADLAFARTSLRSTGARAIG